MMDRFRLGIFLILTVCLMLFCLFLLLGLLVCRLFGGRILFFSLVVVGS